MKTRRSIAFAICRIFFVVLFTYTFVTKFIDFENFKEQIHFAPLLGAFAVLTAYAVLILLFLAILLLSFQRTQVQGIQLTIVLLSLFTLYNTILLVLFENLPCSCIGFYEKWTWEMNLRVNIGLLLIAVFGFSAFHYKLTKKKLRRS